MKKYIYLVISLLTVTLSNAQEIKEELEEV
jgi:hypothetical protein